MLGRMSVLNGARCLGVEQPVVHHLERNARFDQRLVPTERVVFELGLRPVAAVKPRRLLRIDHRHAGERSLMAQIALVLSGPNVEILHSLQPTRGRAACR